MSIDPSGPSDRIDAIFRWFGRLGERSSPAPVLALAMAGMLVAQLGRTIHDVDIFWQLKLGEITVTQGLPAHEPFLAGRETEPLAVVAWLAQVVYACVRTIGGWAFLWLFDALVWFGGFAAVAWACSRRMTNAWPAAIGLWIGWFGALPTASVRPQSFAALAFGLLIVLIRSKLCIHRTALLGGLLFVTWQNLHPSVVVGGLVLVAATAAETLQYFLRKRESLPWRLIVLLPLAAVATVATPAGFDIFRISRLNAELSLHIGVAEWMPMTWHPREAGRAYAWGAFAMTAIVFGLRGGRVRADTLAIVLALAAASLYSHRFVLFWGIAVIPMWCEYFGTEIVERPPPSPWRRPSAALVLALGIGIPCAGHSAPFADYYPIKGIQTLRDSGIRGTIFTTYYWGGMLAEAGHPDWRITHDGRYYLHTAAEWDRYFDETYHGTGGTLDEIVAKYKPEAFFLRPGSDKSLITLLETHPRWRPLFSDANCVVYVPAAAR